MISGQEQLGNYIAALQREESQDNMPAVISLYAEAIARCYRLTGKTDYAHQYFALAARKYFEHMNNQWEFLEGRADEYGDTLHKYARLLWNADDGNAEKYFSEAIESYHRGYDSSNEGIKYVCYEGSIYCLIFLGDYDSALAVAQETYELETTSLLSFPDSLTTLLIQISVSLKKQDKEGLIDAVLSLDEFFKRLSIDLCGRNSIPSVDLYILIKQKLSTSNR